MKYIIILFVLFFTSCHKKDVSQILPEYRLIKNFSKKIEPKSGLILYGYGVNNDLPKGYRCKNGLANFSASYVLYKTQQDAISLNEARDFLVAITENLIQEINTNSDIRSLLDIYPFTSDFLDISIYFKDENRIDLGQGISTIYFSKGKIKYKRYEIYEYRSQYPSIGKHFTVHEESYADALDIVKKQGSLMQLL